MRRLGVIAGLFSLAVLGPAANADAGRPGVRELMALRGHRYALIQTVHGARVSGGTLVSRRLGIWRVPTRTAERIGLRLSTRGLARVIEPDRLVVPQRAAVEPLAGFEWWRAAVGADRAAPPGPGKPVTVIDTGLDVTNPDFAGRSNTILLNAQATPSTDEDEAHGTAVSSVVAAPENGVGLVGIYPQASLQEWDSGAMFVSDVI